MTNGFFDRRERNKGEEERINIMNWDQITMQYGSDSLLLNYYYVINVICKCCYWFNSNYPIKTMNLNHIQCYYLYSVILPSKRDVVIIKFGWRNEKTKHETCESR